MAGVIVQYPALCGPLVYYWPQQTYLGAAMIAGIPPHERIGSEVEMIMANGRALYVVVEFDEDQGVIGCQLLGCEEWAIGI